MNSYCDIEKNKGKLRIIVNIGNQKLDEKLTDNTIKQLAQIAQKYSSRKEIEIVTDLNLNELYEDDNLRWSIVSSLNICKIKNKNERLYKIYDAACKFLDNEFRSKNLCEFENNVCLEKKCSQKINGCCYTFKNKLFGPFIELTPKTLCKFHNDKQCTADCLGCKLFVCDAIKQKRGINYTTNNVPLIKYYFNIFQKIIIRIKVFTHKDKVLKLLKFFSF